jgi:hypothetical protein
MPALVPFLPFRSANSPGGGGAPCRSRPNQARTPGVTLADEVDGSSPCQTPDCRGSSARFHDWISRTSIRAFLDLDPELTLVRKTSSGIIQFQYSRTSVRLNINMAPSLEHTVTNGVNATLGEFEQKDAPVENFRPMKVIVIGAGFSGIYCGIRIPQRLKYRPDNL